MCWMHSLEKATNRSQSSRNCSVLVRFFISKIGMTRFATTYPLEVEMLDRTFVNSAEGAVEYPTGIDVVRTLSGITFATCRQHSRKLLISAGVRLASSKGSTTFVRKSSKMSRYSLVWLKWPPICASAFSTVLILERSRSRRATRLLPLLLLLLLLLVVTFCAIVSRTNWHAASSTSPVSIVRASRRLMSICLSSSNVSMVPKIRHTAGQHLASVDKIS